MDNTGSFSNIFGNIKINYHNLGVEVIRSASDFIGCKDYVDISKNILEARDKFRAKDIEGAVESGRDAVLGIAEKFSNSNALMGAFKVGYNGVDSLINKLTSDAYGGIAKVHNKIADYKEAKAKNDFNSGGTFNDYRKAKENANKHRDLAHKNNQLGREYDGKAVEGFSNALSEIPGAIGGAIFNSETIAGGVAGMLNYGLAHNYLKKGENSIGKDTPKHKLTNSEKAEICANKMKDNFSDNPILRSFSSNTINSSNNNGASSNRANQFANRDISMNGSSNNNVGSLNRENQFGNRNASMNVGSYNNGSSSNNKNKFTNNDSSLNNKNKFTNNDSSSNNKNKFTNNDLSSNNKNKFANNDSSSNNSNNFKYSHS